MEEVELGWRTAYLYDVAVGLRDRPLALVNSDYLAHISRTWKTSRPGTSTEVSVVIAQPRSNGVSRRARSLLAASFASNRSASGLNDSGRIEEPNSLIVSEV